MPFLWRPNVNYASDRGGCPPWRPRACDGATRPGQCVATAVTCIYQRNVRVLEDVGVGNHTVQVRRSVRCLLLVRVGARTPRCRRALGRRAPFVAQAGPIDLNIGGRGRALLIGRSTT